MTSSIVSSSNDNILLDFCEWFHGTLDPVVHKFIQQNAHQFEIKSSLREEQSIGNAEIYQKYKDMVEHEFKLWLKVRAEHARQHLLRKQRVLRQMAAEDPQQVLLLEKEQLEAEQALEKELAKEAFNTSDEMYALTLMQLSDVVTYESLYALMSLRKQALMVPTSASAVAAGPVEQPSERSAANTARGAANSAMAMSVASSARRGSKGGSNISSSSSAVTTQPLAYRKNSNSNSVHSGSGARRGSTLSTASASVSAAAAGEAKKPKPSLATATATATGTVGGATFPVGTTAVVEFSLADVICRTLDDDINSKLKQGLGGLASSSSATAKLPTKLTTTNISGSSSSSSKAPVRSGINEKRAEAGAGARSGQSTQLQRHRFAASSAAAAAAAAAAASESDSEYDED